MFLVIGGFEPVFVKYQPKISLQDQHLGAAARVESEASRPVAFIVAI